MGILGLKKSAGPISPPNSTGLPAFPDEARTREIVAEYKRLQSLRMRLNNKLVSRLPRAAMVEGADRLGMRHRDTFVFDSEDEMCVLMDYCIHDVYVDGRNAVSTYISEEKIDPESDEMVYLRAMLNANYAMVCVLATRPGLGCFVRNLLTNEIMLLVDMGISQTACCGATMATRLINYGDYVTTSGASLPVGVLADEDVAEWLRDLETVFASDDFDPAMIIRECLANGASSRICYENPGSDSGRSLSRRRAVFPAHRRSLPKRKRALAAQQTKKTAVNRRCPCGSGRMAKNCCHKRK